MRCVSVRYCSFPLLRYVCTYILLLLPLTPRPAIGRTFLFWLASLPSFLCPPLPPRSFRLQHFSDSGHFFARLACPPAALLAFCLRRLSCVNYSCIGMGGYEKGGRGKGRRKGGKIPRFPGTNGLNKESRLHIFLKKNRICLLSDGKECT